jgi:hypothetical protein
MSRPPRRVRPAPEPLEARAAAAVIALTASASPAILRPISPRNQPHAVTLQHTLPVTIAGQVADTRGLPAVSFQVIDSYGRDQPAGTIPAQAVGDGRAIFSTRIGLSVLRDPHIPGGRRYVIVVTAADPDGARQALAVVTVPPAGFFHRPAPAGG